MKLLSSYLEQVETAISQIDFPSFPANLYQPLDYFLSISGKRIRPILTLMGAELYGQNNDKALNAALGIELFHNFTLLHDDIMDNAPLRRNLQTVHEKWSNNTAILSGDTLFAISMEYILKGESSSLNQLFLKTAREVCEGQQMDMDFETKNSVSIEEYIEMIRLKTSVLIGCALQAGGIIGGANSEEQKKLYDLGVNIGIAFQLQDDYLDTFGDSPKVGKQIGGDILNNKKTFLFLKALDVASEAEIAQLYQLQNESDSVQKINKTTALFQALNIPDLTKEQINFYFQKGITNLDELNLSEDRKTPLKEIITFLYNRNF